MKWTIVAFGMLAASPALAMGPCALCSLGQVLQGMQGQPQPQYQAPIYDEPYPRYTGPQFHRYTFPNGGTMRCTTVLQGTPSETTTCR